MTVPAPPAKPIWQQILGPIADAGVVYYESNEPALAPIIASLEAKGEAGMAAVIAAALSKQSPILRSLGGSLAAAIESGIDAAIAQYGAPAVALALVDKELHYAAAALGG